MSAISRKIVLGINRRPPRWIHLIEKKKFDRKNCYILKLWKIDNDNFFPYQLSMNLDRIHCHRHCDTLNLKYSIFKKWSRCLNNSDNATLNEVQIFNFVEVYTMFTWKERWISAVVRLRARESVSLAYAGPVQVNVCRIRSWSRWTNDLWGQHEPTRGWPRTSERQSVRSRRDFLQLHFTVPRVRAALYKGHSVDTGWLTVDLVKKSITPHNIQCWIFRIISILRTWRF